MKNKAFFKSTQKDPEHGKYFPVQLTNQWTLYCECLTHTLLNGLIVKRLSICSPYSNWTFSIYKSLESSRCAAVVKKKKIKPLICHKCISGGRSAQLYTPLLESIDYHKRIAILRPCREPKFLPQDTRCPCCLLDLNWEKKCVLLGPKD